MDQQQREQQQREQQQREQQQRELQQRQQPQRAGSIAGFYRAQVESAQDLTSASMEGFERIQQLALQAMRQQIDNQFRLVNTVAARSAEAVVDPELARPALDRMIDVQRQLADTFVRTNQRVLSAVTSSAQRTVEHGTALSGNGDQQPTDVQGYSSMVQTAFQQWQELSNRMLDAFSQQFSTATGEIQRQGQRALDQTSEAVQAGVRGVQAGAQQAGQGMQAGQQQGQRAKTPERKPEMA
jgi:phasin family protein